MTTRGSWTTATALVATHRNGGGVDWHGRCLPALPGGRKKLQRNRSIIANRLERWGLGERRSLWIEASRNASLDDDAAVDLVRRRVAVDLVCPARPCSGSQALALPSPHLRSRMPCEPSSLHHLFARSLQAGLLPHRAGSCPKMMSFVLHGPSPRAQPQVPAVFAATSSSRCLARMALITNPVSAS